MYETYNSSILTHQGKVLVLGHARFQYRHERQHAVEHEFRSLPRCLVAVEHGEVVRRLLVRREPGHFRPQPSRRKRTGLVLHHELLRLSDGGRMQQVTKR